MTTPRHSLSIMHRIIELFGSTQNKDFVVSSMCHCKNKVSLSYINTYDNIQCLERIFSLRFLKILKIQIDLFTHHKLIKRKKFTGNMRVAYSYERL